MNQREIENVKLRIERLKSRDPVANAKLIKKWERRLRKLEDEVL